jgi:hypothetical protein
MSAITQATLSKPSRPTMAGVKAPAPLSKDVAANKVSRSGLRRTRLGQWRQAYPVNIQSCSLTM